MTDVDRARAEGAGAVLVAVPDSRRAAAIARALAAEHLMPVMAFTGPALVDFAADPAVAAVVVDPDVAGPDDDASRRTPIVQRVRSVTGAPLVVLGFVPGDRHGPIHGDVDGLLGPDAPAADVVGTVLTALARRGNAADEVVAYADLVVDVRNYEAWQGTRPLTLTPTELRVLGVLVAAQGDVVTKRDLQKAAWGSAGAHEDNRLQAHVRRLRAKLDGDARSGPSRLRTVRGVGFRLEPAGAPLAPNGPSPPTEVGDAVHVSTETGAKGSAPRR